MSMNGIDTRLGVVASSRLYGNVIIKNEIRIKISSRSVKSFFEKNTFIFRSTKKILLPFLFLSSISQYVQKTHRHIK
jgi:hypothetical protein